MNEIYEMLKVKNLLWRKRYDRYFDEVHKYELYAQKKYSLCNAVIFFVYGVVCYLWNEIFSGSAVNGALLCICVSVFSLTDYILCRTFLKEHIKYATMVADIYILLLGKMLLSIDLMWNEMNGGNVSWTLLMCSLIVTATLSMVPGHYALTMLGLLTFDTIECIAEVREISAVLQNLADGILLAVFCIGLNIIYSEYKYTEFAGRDELKLESSRN
jgi:hypothetical protein